MNPVLLTELRAVLGRGDVAAICAFAEDQHPANLAESIQELPPGELSALLRYLAPRLRGEVFSYLPPDEQVALAGRFKRQELAELVTHMSPDERADLVKRLPEATLDSLWPGLAQAEREDIRALTAYPEGTAGAVMTSDYVTLFPDLTVREALEKIRREAPDRETVYYAYVVGVGRSLLGFVSLKDLILAKPVVLVRDLMHEDPIRSAADEDQEAVARKIEKFDLLAVPVVNDQGALVGIVTHDDAFDILRQEQTEDIERLMAISGRHQAGVYLKTSPWVHFQNRAYWIVGLAALGLASGLIIHGFESSLVNLMILALYMPMVADTGGNTGSQSATVVVRALALGEITPRDGLRVLWKEFQIAVLLALVLGFLSWGKVLFLSRGADLPAGFSLLSIGGAIGLALGLQVVTATVIGALLPLAAARLKFDPAVVASPALTTVVDITGLLIYFTTAKLLLGI